MPTLQLTLLSAAISGALGFGSAWKLQSLRADALEKYHVEQKLAQEQDSRRFDQARTSALASAQNAGVARQAVLRSDADAARGALDGMRESNDRALSYARTSLEACTVAATTYSELFTESTKRYSDLAEKAGRHASDIQMMQEAWPK